MLLKMRDEQTLWFPILITQVTLLQVLVAQVENGTIWTKDNACRTESGQSLSLEEFRFDTCARCYLYLPPWAFADGKRKFGYDPRGGLLIDPLTNISYEADPKNISISVMDTFQSDLFAKKWMACCQEALQCCDRMISQTLPTDTDGAYCPRTWDGWQCWSDTPSGETTRSPCKEHVYFMSEPPPCPRYAVKTCWANGTWFVNEWGREWTNYSGCGRVEGIRRLQHFHIATYTLSILFLIPALAIFMTYKQLQVYRITMHKNLFIALLINALFAITFKCIVILDELEHSGNRRTLLEDNGEIDEKEDSLQGVQRMDDCAVGCKLLYLLTKYSRMTTYMWMFCEGFYLHKLIAAAFAEQKSLLMFYIIGWVFPVFPVSTFALMRWNFADERCWAIPVKPYEWVTNSPNLLSLVLNLAFLCNIIRVLVTKLRATHANEPSQFRKAVRATLVLVPLFGLHFFLIIYRPQSGECSALEGYTFFSYAMDGLQGFLVSLIFCYLNGEVTDLLKRTCYRVRLRYSLDARPSSVTQLSNMSDLSTPCDRRRSRLSLDSSTGDNGSGRRCRRPLRGSAYHGGSTELRILGSISRKGNETNFIETTLVNSE